MAAEESNTGIKLSQLGQDVNTAADQDLIFSSSFPYVKIIARGEITIGDVTNDQLIYKHDLGYVPAYLLYFISTTDPFVSNTPYSITSGSQSGGYVVIDENELSWKTYFPGGNYNLKLYYIIYDINLKEDFSSPIKTTASLSPASISTDYGMKVLRGDKTNINSSDLRDFSLHSSTRSPILHKVEYVDRLSLDESVYATNIEHGLPYNPMFLTYVSFYQDPFNLDSIVNKWFYLPTGTGGNYSVNTDKTRIYFTTTSSLLSVSFVVLKDPFTISNDPTVEVTT